MKSTYTLLIPAYNAEKSLAELFTAIKQSTSGHVPDAVVIVDDGSTDNTAEVARGFTEHIIRHTRNRGKGAALKSGFSYFLKNLNSAYLICMDADMQHPPEYIRAFLNIADNCNKAVVVGRRSFTPPAMPLLRVLSNTITSQMISGMLGQKIPDSQCGYRLIKRDVIPLLHLREDGFQMESEFFFRCKEQNIPIGFCSIPTVYTRYGSSMHHLRDTFAFLKLLLREARQ